MAMWLTGTAFFARIEEGEESPVAFIRAPCPQAIVGGFQISLFEEISLSFPISRYEKEVIRDNGEFVEDEGVGRGFWGEPRKQEFR